MALTDLTLRLPDLEAPSATGQSWENKYPYPSFELPSGTVTIRTNLYPRPFPADSGTAGFSSSHVGAVLANEAVEVDDRPRSVKVTTNGVAAAQGVLAQAGYRPTTGIAGAEVHAARVKAPAGAEMRLWLQEYTVSPVAWVANRGSVNFIGTGDWQTVSVGGTKATAGNAMVLVVETRTAQAITFYVTKFFAVVGSNLGDYFDWLTPDAGDFEYLATGVEGNSTSIMRAKGLLGVSDDGVYQSQEWADEGTHSAFVPTGKTLTVALAEPSTVKVIARSAGQTMVGSTGVEVRRNACIRPIANDSWTQSYGTGGAGTTTTVDDARFPGGKARKMTWSVLPSNNANLYHSGGAVPAAVAGERWLYRYRTAKTWAGHFNIYTGGTAQTLIAQGVIDNGDGTFDSWKIVQFNASGSNAALLNPPVTSSLSDEFLAGGAQFEKVPAGTTTPDAFPYFDGNTPPSVSGFPVWASAENASETILYGATTDTATGADETLEVQATGHVALLEGYWDVLTVVEGSVASQVEERRNLYPQPVPQESGTTGFRGIGSTTISNEAGVIHERSRSIKAVCSGVANSEGVAVALDAAYRADSGVAGLETHSVWVLAPSGTPLFLECYARNAANTSPQGLGNQSFTATGSWQRVSLTGTKTDATRTTDWAIRTTGTLAVTFYVSEAMAEVGSTLNPYFDGNTPPTLDGDEVIAYAWAGAENASESIQYRQTMDWYTGPAFTGSSDITGYETAWLGAINESASTLTELIPGSPPIEEILSWSVTEPGTPHNVHARNGSTGTASITAKATTDTFWTISEDATVTVDGLEGSFEGTIDSTRIQPFNEHGDPSGVTTFSVASVLNLLNAERTLPPVIEKPLSEVIQGYVAAVTPNLNITWLAFDDPIRTYGAWSGNVWDILKTVCAANKLEMALSGSTVLVRDLGTQIIRFDDPAHPGFDIENVSLSVTPGSGQYVEITYRDSTAINNQVTYNYVGNPSVEVNATGYGVDIRGFGSVTGSRVSN